MWRLHRIEFPRRDPRNAIRGNPHLLISDLETECVFRILQYLVWTLDEGLQLVVSSHFGHCYLDIGLVSLF
jgi:hypothetical protein